MFFQRLPRKSVEIWRALAGFEELLEAMDHRFAELWEAEMHEANSANERLGEPQGGIELGESIYEYIYDYDGIIWNL